MKVNGQERSPLATCEIDSDQRRTILAQSTIVGACKTLALAKARCLPFREKLCRLKGGLNEEFFDELIFSLGESVRSKRQNAELASVVADLAKQSDYLRTHERARLDRRIGKLVRLLPFGLAQPIVIDLLLASSKQRRQIAIQCIRSQVLDDHLVQLLWNRFRETNDKSMLKAILGKPLPLAVLDSFKLIDSFDDDYWKMRVIEATLKTDISRSTEFESSYPLSFIWACGRLGDRSMVSKVSSCLSNAHDKAALIDIAAWALGKLGATAELKELEALLNELLEQFALAASNSHEVPS